MKNTSLYEEHVKLGGHMVEFAGWRLPVMYASIIAEHMATRTRAGLFDVSHMGKIYLRGKNAADLLRVLIPTRLEKLSPMTSMYSCFCNERGGVVDDIFVFMISYEEFCLVVNAATTEKDIEWMWSHNDMGVDIENVSDTVSKIDIQGPRAREILSAVVSDNAIASLERFHFIYATFSGARCMISCTGYTGEMGYELLIDNSSATELWRALLAVGGSNIQPVGLGARDSLRLEACYSLYGHELNDDITPVEAGLRWLVNSDDTYIGSDVLRRQKEEGAPREIVCFELTGKGVPREHCAVTKGGVEIGVSTSGGYSPTFKKGIGMALVRRNAVKPGDAVEVALRGSGVPAVIVKRPFYAFNG